MTAREAMVRYGNVLNDGYVSCDNCPVDRTNCDRMGKSGFEDCWDAIASFINEQQDTTADNVNHPQHYESGKFECIEVMTEAIGCEAVKSFCLCNAFKYIYRCTKKHETPTEDVKKAVWYLNKFLELEG